jgi:putative N6-adenine-specific DNA methylase
MENLVITVKTLFGFEQILEDELNELGYSKVEKGNRSAQLHGNWKDVYRINYLSRLAISVLVEIEQFHIHSEDDLYKKARKIDWTKFFDVGKTFSVKGAVFSKLFNHTNYPILVVKDAIVDTFRDKFGERPNVELKSPQVVIDVYIADKKVVLSLNTSGVPLFQRGYRQQTGEAPMNEVLAAGLLRLSGWDRKSTLIDPMCGSGTIAIEAALWAANIPSLIERNHFAFMNFASFDSAAWEEVRQEGNDRPVQLDFPIIAADMDAGMIRKAQRNARVAPIGKMIQFETAEFSDFDPPEGGGTLIMNPPYGERMGDEMIALYEEIGDTFKQKYAGYSCWVVSSNIEAIKRVGLKPNSKIKVFNGSLECSFRLFEVFEGSLKDKLAPDGEGKKEEIETEKKDKKKDKKKETRLERYYRLQEEKKALEESSAEQDSKDTTPETETPAIKPNQEEIHDDYQEATREEKVTQPEKTHSPRVPKKEEDETKKVAAKTTKYNQPKLKYTVSKTEDDHIEEEAKKSSSNEPAESTEDKEQSKIDSKLEKDEQHEEKSFKDKIEQMKKYRKRE